MSESSPPSVERRLHRQPLEQRSLQSLDWQLLIDALAERASTEAGRRLCVELPFLPDARTAQAALGEVAEMLALREAGSAPKLGGIEDVAPLLRAVRKGEILLGLDLLAIGHSLESLASLRGQLDDVAPQVPALHAHAIAIKPLPDLAAWLNASFDNRGELDQQTYPQLTALRGRKAKLHSRIRATLDDLRGQDRFEETLQDDFTGLRNDRYVVPLKAQHKNAGLGIVHDTSGSGATVFVEPWEIVELNNELKICDAELRQEERRILRDLSERVALVASEIERGLRAAAVLDLVGAKARLGEALGATVPRVVEGARLSLKGARHPVLVLEGVDVVPNDIELGTPAQGLVLSGPNTGGKTITLKTLGLAALMVRAGLPVAAAEGSVVGWFDRVLTDIGDLQGVQEGLSTFSAHVLSLKEILALVERGEGTTMVLIDEIAAGTDPVQGSALGRAILTGLVDRRVLLATTTHFPDLKALSTTDDRFLSGRVEFDSSQGVPTYRLTVGRPGSSHAIDVAAAMGLPEDVLARAREHLDPTAASVEGMLSGLEAEAIRARNARDEALADRAAAAAELEVVRAERDELKRRRKTLEKDLRAEFDAEVRGYRDAVRSALRQMKREQSEAAAERARERINTGAHAARDKIEGWAEGGADLDRIDVTTLAVGDRVRVATLGKDVTLAELPDKKGRVTVDVAGMRLQVKASDLQGARSAAPVPKKAKAPPKRVEIENAESPETAFRSDHNTVDLRGCRLDESLERVEQRLDDAFVAGEDFIFVLHGHGTGALKKGVRELLRRSAYVAKWASGTRSQGGDGISVVKIKR